MADFRSTVFPVRIRIYRIQGFGDDRQWSTVRIRRSLLLENWIILSSAEIALISPWKISKIYNLSQFFRDIAPLNQNQNQNQNQINGMNAIEHSPGMKCLCTSPGMNALWHSPASQWESAGYECRIASQWKSPLLIRGVGDCKRKCCYSKYLSNSRYIILNFGQF